MKKTIAPLLGDFYPPEVLWAGPEPIFPSQNSWLWFLRSNKEALKLAQAIIQHTGRIGVHPERVKQVALSVAIGAVRRNAVNLPPSNEDR